ncbi:MAG: NfeD family protein [Calditrichota bacterium]
MDSFNTALGSLLSSGLAWFILGVILLVVELAAPGILAIFFTAGAWTTAILLWIGIIKGTTWPLVIFLVVSLASLLLLRRRVKAVVKTKLDTEADTDEMLDDFIGKTAPVVEAINGREQTGKVEIRGARWEAKAAQPIPAGTTVIIQDRDNLTLVVKPLEE